MRKWLSTLAPYARVNFRATFNLAVMALIAIELGGIWHDLHEMRNEQVKSAYYALPEARRKALRGTAAQRNLESTTNVSGTVGINGSVEVEQPVEVDIDQ